MGSRSERDWGSRFGNGTFRASSARVVCPSSERASFGGLLKGVRKILGSRSLAAMAVGGAVMVGTVAGVCAYRANGVTASAYEQGAGVTVIDAGQGPYANLPHAGRLAIAYSIGEGLGMTHPSHAQERQIKDTAAVVASLIESGVPVSVMGPGKHAVVFAKSTDPKGLSAQAEFSLGESIGQSIQALHGKFPNTDWGKAMSKTYAAVRMRAIGIEMPTWKRIVMEKMKNADNEMGREALAEVLRDAPKIEARIRREHGAQDLMDWYRIAQKLTTRACGPRPKPSAAEAPAAKNRIGDIEEGGITIQTNYLRKSL